MIWAREYAAITNDILRHEGTSTVLYNCSYKVLRVPLFAVVKVHLGTDIVLQDKKNGLP